MSAPSKNSALLGFLVLLLCGIGIWSAVFFMQDANLKAKAPAPAPATKAPESKPRSQSAPVDAKPAEPVETPQPPAQDRISAIISNPNLDFPSAVNQLLEALPSLDEEEQDEAAHHIANLSEDKTAESWIGMVVKNQLPAPALDVLFNDMLNRPHELLMPALANMADQASHPKKSDSVEVLEVLYGTPDQGYTWSAWVKQKMSEEPAAQ